MQPIEYQKSVSHSTFKISLNTQEAAYLTEIIPHTSENWSYPNCKWMQTKTGDQYFNYIIKRFYQDKIKFELEIILHCVRSPRTLEEAFFEDIDLYKIMRFRIEFPGLFNSIKEMSDKHKNVKGIDK